MNKHCLGKALLREAFKMWGASLHRTQMAARKRTTMLARLTTWVWGLNMTYGVLLGLFSCVESWAVWSCPSGADECLFAGYWWVRQIVYSLLATIVICRTVERKVERRRVKVIGQKPGWFCRTCSSTSFWMGVGLLVASNFANVALVMGGNRSHEFLMHYVVGSNCQILAVLLLGRGLFELFWQYKERVNPMAERYIIFVGNFWFWGLGFYVLLFLTATGLVLFEDFGELANELIVRLVSSSFLIFLGSIGTLFAAYGRTLTKVVAVGKIHAANREYNSLLSQAKYGDGQGHGGRNLAITAEELPV